MMIISAVTAKTSSVSSTHIAMTQPCDGPTEATPCGPCITTVDKGTWLDVTVGSTEEILLATAGVHHSTYPTTNLQFHLNSHISKPNININKHHGHVSHKQHSTVSASNSMWWFHINTHCWCVVKKWLTQSCWRDSFKLVQSLMYELVVSTLLTHSNTHINAY